MTVFFIIHISHNSILLFRTAAWLNIANSRPRESANVHQLDRCPHTCRDGEHLPVIECGLCLCSGERHSIPWASPVQHHAGRGQLSWTWDGEVAAGADVEEKNIVELDCHVWLEGVVEGLSTVAGRGRGINEKMRVSTWTLGNDVAHGSSDCIASICNC